MMGGSRGSCSRSRSSMGPESSNVQQAHHVTPMHKLDKQLQHFSAMLCLGATFIYKARPWPAFPLLFFSMYQCSAASANGALRPSLLCLLYFSSNVSYHFEKQPVSTKISPTSSSLSFHTFLPLVSEEGVGHTLVAAGIHRRFGLSQPDSESLLFHVGHRLGV